MLPSRMRFIATPIFLVTYFLTTIQSEDVALPEEPPPANPPDPKILSSCTSKLSNSRYTLTCSGYLSVPTNDPIFKEINPAQVGTLVLTKNHLQTVKPSEFTFASFDNLIEIDLSRNQINDIKRGAFGGLSLLWKIDLSFNKINTLDMEAFESINKLQYLNLQGNPIHKFEGSSFPLLPSLKSLDLRDCSINFIPTNAFRNLKDLEQLYLGGNRIERLDWNLFTSNTVLHHLQLKNNPWNCDCHVKFLMNFFKNIMVVNAIKSDDITCSQPQRLNGTLWNAVPLDSLICPPLVKPLKTILSHPAHDDQVGNDKVYMSYGKDVAFECIIEADPAPEVFWLKDGTDLKFASGEGALGSSRDLKSSPAHFEMLDVDMKLRENYKQFNYEYRKLLRIYNTQLEDIGLYSCQARSPVGEHASKIFLNFSSIPDGTTTISPVNAGGGTLLIWLLVLLGILILLCFIMCIFYLWRRRDDKRQKKLREQMLEKFKVHRK
jgi:netrin-G1 ligand